LTNLLRLRAHLWFAGSSKASQHINHHPDLT
jgi:hypothetical protein